MPDTTTSPPSADSSQPIPPRYWWLKRILIGVGMLIVALAILRWWWGHEADRRLQAKIDEYRAAGQPVLIEDFKFPPVPDEENAAHFLMQAATALTRPPAPDAAIEEIYHYPEALPDHADAVGRWVAANSKALEFVRAARSTDKVDWKTRFTSPVINMLLPSLSPQRDLAKFLSTTALYQHSLGDHATAVETLRDMLAQGRSLFGGQPVLISCLVAVANDALTCYRVESIAPTLQIVPADSPAASDARPALSSQVRALIADLLDEQPVREGWRRGMFGERLFALDIANVTATTPGGMAAIAGGPNLPSSAMAKLLEPMFTLDAAFMMEHTTRAADASACASYPEALRLMRGYPAFESGIERHAHVLSSILLPSLEGMVHREFTTFALRRLAATALAIRLYEVEHGWRPARLEALVPDYLPDLPSDPFAHDGGPLGYRADAAKPIIYSVGVDGIDDGGAYEMGGGGAVDVDAKDLVFFLDGDRPRSPPPALASQPATADAVEDNGEPVDDERKPDQGQPADDQ